MIQTKVTQMERTDDQEGWRKPWFQRMCFFCSNNFYYTMYIILLWWMNLRNFLLFFFPLRIHTTPLLRSDYFNVMQISRKFYVSNNFSSLFQIFNLMTFIPLYCNLCAEIFAFFTPIVHHTCIKFSLPSWLMTHDSWSSSFIYRTTIIIDGVSIQYNL